MTSKPPAPSARTNEFRLIPAIRRIIDRAILAEHDPGHDIQSLLVAKDCSVWPDLIGQHWERVRWSVER